MATIIQARKGKTVELHNLKRGDRVRTAHGALAEVMSESEDGRWIRVRYLEVQGEPALVGTEDLCSEEDIAEFIASEGAKN